MILQSIRGLADNCAILPLHFLNNTFYTRRPKIKFWQIKQDIAFYSMCLTFINLVKLASKSNQNAYAHKKLKIRI